jgi:aspartate/methionine/tyrosine aminotransferase
VRPEPFALERFFARHEFTARHLLSTSDCQGLPMADLVTNADDDLRARWEGLRLGYTESQGLPELRTEIATLYETVAGDQVLVAAPEEAVFLAMNALLEPGDHVVCTFPGYQSLYEVARGIGCEVSLWKPSEGPLWRFDLAELQALLRPDTKLVVWNFPHNPTGAVPAPEDYAGMVDIVVATGAWIFSDEMYRLLEPSEEVRLPTAVDKYERAVSLSGMSKAFGLAGLRIGWVAARDGPLLERMSTLKDYTTICSSAPSELLALMGLRSRDTILAENRERVRRNVELATRFFERYRSLLSWVPPQGGTVCFPRLTDAFARTAGGAEAFCRRVLEDTGVLLLPSTAYGYGDLHFRLGLGRDDFAEGLRVLDEYHSRGHQEGRDRGRRPGVPGQGTDAD